MMEYPLPTRPACRPNYDPFLLRPGKKGEDPVNVAWTSSLCFYIFFPFSGVGTVSLSICDPTPARRQGSDSFYPL